MQSIELNFVVSDSIAASNLYKDIFSADIIEQAKYEKGLSEAVFTINGMRFHILDENEEYSLYAPEKQNKVSMWVNVTVSDIQETYKKALSKGCKEIKPITEIAEKGLKNAVFSDPYGYIWLLHQIV